MFLANLLRKSRRSLTSGPRRENRSRFFLHEDRTDVRFSLHELASLSTNSLFYPRRENRYSLLSPRTRFSLHEERTDVRFSLRFSLHELASPSTRRANLELHTLFKKCSTNLPQYPDPDPPRPSRPRPRPRPRPRNRHRQRHRHRHRHTDIDIDTHTHTNDVPRESP